LQAPPAVGVDGDQARDCLAARAPVVRFLPKGIETGSG